MSSVVRPATSYSPRPAPCRRWIAALLLLPAAVLAQAVDSDEARTPSWALGDDRCSYTLISSRVALTTLACAEEAMYPTRASALVFTQRRSGHRFPGKVLLPKRLIHLPPAGLALATFDADVFVDSQRKPTAGAPIPSYSLEANLLKDPLPTAPRTAGTRFVVVKGEFMIHGYPTRGVQNGPIYHSIDRPLVYRSLNYLRQTERQRFKRMKGPELSSDDLLGEQLKELKLERIRGGHRHDDFVITLAGTLTDEITMRRPAPDAMRPFEAHLGGSALMASLREDPYPGVKQGVYMVGLISGDGLFHTRLSAHWPAIYEALVKAKQIDAARRVATQVLDLKFWSADRLGTVGDLYGRVHPTTGAFEFFRLRKLTDGGTYWDLPVDGRDNEWWEFLGTKLPTRAEVLGLKSPPKRAPAASASLTPPRGSAP